MRRAGWPRVVLALCVSIVAGSPIRAVAQDLISAADAFYIRGALGEQQSDPLVLTTPDDGFVMLWRVNGCMGT